MIRTKEIKQTIQDPIEIECDNCHKIITKDDWSEWQEVLKISFVGGFSSVFGDGSKMELQLCQECVNKILGHLLRKTGDMVW